MVGGDESAEDNAIPCTEGEVIADTWYVFGLHSLMHYYNLNLEMSMDVTDIE